MTVLISKPIQFLKGGRDARLLVLSYLIAHGGVFFILSAIYWDDWVLYNHDAGDILSRFAMAGTPFGLVGHMHAFMQIIGPIGYKLSSFCLYLGSIVLLSRLLIRQRWISVENCYVIALLFAVLPFNFSRVMEIALPYALCNFLFFLAWHIFPQHRVMALPLFFLAFFIPSFLVFYLLPVIELVVRDLFADGFRYHAGVLKKLSVWTFRNSMVVALPFIFYLIKIKYFQASGPYAGYYEGFGLEKVWPALKIVYSDFLGQDVSVPLLIIGLVLGLAVLPRMAAPVPNARLLVVGAIAIALALFPYLILGLAPVFDEWPASRHQLLLPLGFACVATGVAGYMSAGWARALVGLILAISLAMNWNFYYLAYLDWSKQTSVLAFLRDSDFKETSVILIDDRTEGRFRRTLGFYEWSGIVKLAYGDQTRFAMRKEEYPNYLSGQYDQYFVSMYNAGQHVRREDNAVRVLVIDYVKQVGAPPLAFGRQSYSIRLAPLLAN